MENGQRDLEKRTHEVAELRKALEDKTIEAKVLALKIVTPKLKFFRISLVKYRH